jgi:hypothetical protein
MVSIFSHLPDMLKQQVLEFAFSNNNPFHLCYNPKTKRIMKQVNKTFMCKALEFKVNNPSKYMIMRDHNGRFIGETFTIITPPKIQAYTIMISKITNMDHIEIHQKYQKYIQKYNDMMRRKKELMNLQNLSIRSIYPENTFRETILKMSVRDLTQKTLRISNVRIPL